MKLKIGEIQEFDPARVKPFADQPRKRFSGIRELAQSISAVGQIIPGKVIGTAGKQFDVQLIDGERRLRACVLAKTKFRAEVCSPDSKATQFEQSLAANFGKQDHDCMEIAHALKQLKDAGRTVKQIGDICGGKSDCWVYQHLALLNLHPTVQVMLVPAGEQDDDEERPLNLSNALKLAQFEQKDQISLAKKIEGKSMLEARRIIHHRAVNTPGKSQGRVRSASERFESLTRCIVQMTHRLGIYVDMPHTDLLQAIVQAAPDARQDLILYINELNDQLSGIADEVEKLVPKRKAC